MEDFYETSYVKAGRDGRRPRLCVTYHDADGRRRERTRSAKPKRMSALRREAEEWRAELNDEWREREAEEEERRRREEVESRIPMLSDYMRDFVVDRLGEGIERSTALGYEWRVKQILCPDAGLSDLRLDQLTPDACRSWVRHMFSERGMSPATISGSLTLLRCALNRAVEDGLIADNPTSRVKAPKSRGDRPNALDRLSVARLVSWVDGGDGDWFTTAVAIALYTGMRVGEIAALSWRDVDMERGTIHLCHAIGRAKEGEYVKPPKNGHARDIGMPGVLMRVMGRRRDAVRADVAKLYPEDEVPLRMSRLYVCGDVDGKWRSPMIVTNHWRRLRDELHLRGFERERCPFHDLRHTYITYLLNAGVPVTKIMSIVGHTSAAVTLDVYASVDPELVMEVSRSVGEVYDSVCAGEYDPKPVYELPSDHQ